MGEIKNWTLEKWLNDKPEEEQQKFREAKAKVIQKSPKSSPSRKSISIKSPEENIKDKAKLSRGRLIYEGFHIGHYNQPPPVIFSRDGHNMFLGDMYRGACAFLLLGGPSTKTLNLELLNQPGILSMSVNNAIKTFRTNLWTCVDSPDKFVKSLWLDPTITKFVPMTYTEKELWDNENWKPLGMVAGASPNTFFYRRNEHFQPEQFLFENTVNWGNHSNLCNCGYWRPDSKKTKQPKITVCPNCGEKSFGTRSVILAAIRLLYYLGVRYIFLLGCDFEMKDGIDNYSFPQKRTKALVQGNNNSYSMLTKRFEELQPIFLKNRFQIFNCNPESKLKVFPFVSFTEAVQTIQKMLPDVKTERTEGMYERSHSRKRKNG